MNVIKVTGNNRKAVLAFLNEYMRENFKPCNHKQFSVHSKVCYIEIMGTSFKTHFTYKGELTTLKAVKELYKPKETKAEKTQRSRAMMYKLKYEQLRDNGLIKDLEISNRDTEIARLTRLTELNELSNVALKSKLDSVTKTSNNRLGIIKRNQQDNDGKNKLITKLTLELDEANKIICNVSKQLDTNQSLYMKERETTTHLTQKFEASEIEVQHLKREKKGLIDENVYLSSEVVRYRGISTRKNANKIQSELIYEKLLSQHKSLNDRFKRYKIALYISWAFIILTPILRKWIG